MWSSSFSSSASMNLRVIWGFSLPSNIVLGARLTLVVLGLFCCVNAVCFLVLHGGVPWTKEKSGRLFVVISLMK